MKIIGFVVMSVREYEQREQAHERTVIHQVAVARWYFEFFKRMLVESPVKSKQVFAEIATQAPQPLP